MTQPVGTIDVVTGAARIAGLAAMAGVLGVVIAVAYRWYARDRVPAGLAILVGLTGVAIYLNTTTALGQVIGGARGLLDLDAALLNTTTFLVATVAAVVGGRAGDRMAREAAVVTGARELDTDVGRIVRSVGRVTPVTLPAADDIENLDGYEAAPAATKGAIAGKTLLFPRGLTVAELEDRLISRLKEDHAVGHVGVELAKDGTVEYLGIGSRTAGIGPTLAPGTAATAVRADPPTGATSGDVVQVWRTGEAIERVAVGTVRAATDDIVTLVLDEHDAESLDPDTRYRLVTLPAEPRIDQEFAALLRSADETMGAVSISEGSILVGTPLGALDTTVVAVRQAGGSVEAIPPRGYTFAGGDTLYVIARPEAIRRLEAAAAPPAAAPSDGSGPADAADAAAGGPRDEAESSS